MDDVREINEKLDEQDLRLEKKDKELNEKIAERDAERASKNRNGERILKLNKEIKGIENGKKEIERKQKVAFRQLARTTEEGKELQRQYDEDETTQKAANKVITQLNEDWNVSEGKEKEEIGIERADLKEKISELEKDKAGIVSKLEEIGRELRTQYKEGTLAVKEEEQFPDSGDNEQPEEEPTETQDEAEPIIDEKLNSESSKEDDEKVVKTEQSSEEIFAKIEDEVKGEQATRYGFSKEAQEGIDLIARIRNLRLEYEDILKSAFEKMPETTLEEGLIADFGKLEEIVAEKFGLNQEEEQEEETTVIPNQDAMDVILQQIDNIKVDLESTTGDELKEKMLEKFGNLRDAVPETIPEQNKAEIIDFIENVINYVGSEFLFETEADLKNWIMQDLEILKECLPEKFGVISQEQEEAAEEQQPEVGEPMPTKENVATEWMPGVQQPGNFEEEKKGEDMNQNSEPENAPMSTGDLSSKEKNSKEREELGNKIEEFETSIRRKEDSIKHLEIKASSLPEGSDERAKVEKELKRQEGELEALKWRKGGLQKDYNPEKDTSTPKPTIHIKGIEGTPNEIKLLKMLNDSGLMRQYEKKFSSGNKLPDMSLDVIGSLMEDVAQKVKWVKKNSKKGIPKRKALMEEVRYFNKYKRKIKKQMELIRKQMEEKDLDDYEYEI